MTGAAGRGRRGSARHRLLTALTLTGLLVLSACADHQPAVVLTPRPAPSHTTSVCESLAPSVQQSVEVGAQLPDGATTVRLCRDPFEYVTSPAPPSDVLTSGAQDLVAKYNSLPTRDKDTNCTSEAGPSFLMVFGYPNVQVIAIRGELFGCGEMGGRLGAKTLFDDFQTRLRKQRAARPSTPGAEASARAQPTR